MLLYAYIYIFIYWARFIYWASSGSVWEVGSAQRSMLTLWASRRVSTWRRSSSILRISAKATSNRTTSASCSRQCWSSAAVLQLAPLRPRTHHKFMQLQRHEFVSIGRLIKPVVHPPRSVNGALSASRYMAVVPVFSLTWSNMSDSGNAEQYSKRVRPSADAWAASAEEIFKNPKSNFQNVKHSNLNFPTLWDRTSF